MNAFEVFETKEKSPSTEERIRKVFEGITQQITRLEKKNEHGDDDYADGMLDACKAIAGDMLMKFPELNLMEGP